LNDPEYRRRLQRRNDLRQAVMSIMAETSLMQFYTRINGGLSSHWRRSSRSEWSAIERDWFSRYHFSWWLLTAERFCGAGVPVGLELVGPDWSELVLIKLAYGFEQIPRIRKPPASTPRLGH
jgi:hypothetical protein